MRLPRAKSIKSKTPTRKLAREKYGGEAYEYYPPGKYIVSAPGFCGGRPTFKYTRLEVSVILGLIASGATVQEVIERYSSSKLTPEAVEEAINSVPA